MRFYSRKRRRSLKNSIVGFNEIFIKSQKIHAECKSHPLETAEKPSKKHTETTDDDLMVSLNGIKMTFTTPYLVTTIMTPVWHVSISYQKIFLLGM